MKRIAKNCLPYFVVAFTLLLGSCSEEDSEKIIPEIKLNKSVIGISIGETDTLTIISNIDKSNAVWTSNKNGIASVDSNGMVTGVSIGTAVVTSKVRDSKAVCTVVISEKKLELELNKQSLTLFSFPTYKETLQVISDIGENTIVWESSDENVATVDENGEIIPISVGETIISATVNDVSAICIVTVIEGPVTLLELDQPELEMDKFDTAKLNVSSLESQSEEMGPQIWESSNEDLVTVDHQGNLTSYGLDGSAIITLTIDNLSVECLVTIGPKVYVVGDDGDVISLWKNGIGENLTVDNSDSNGNSIYVDNNDTYVAGYTNNGMERIATVWKNGTVLHSFTDGTKDAKAKAVFVDGTDVYTTGYEDNDQGKKIAKVWRNADILYQLTDGSNDALAYSSFMDSGDLYTVGYEKNVEDVLVSKVWRNGVELYILTNGDFDSIVYSVSAIGNEVYATGYERNQDNTLVAKVWRNDEEHYVLSNDQFSANAYTLFANGNDIYVAGYANNDQGERVAKIWLNGASLYDLTISSGNGRAYSVYTSEGNVYAAGYEENSEGVEIAKVWKNGEELYELSDGSKNTTAYSVHVE
ncbi:Ig-like domain-containing protein [Flagellimonas sp. 389]|uniref:Ig-like domain-containing protein n=1 Tax=Flagellimonas sp. 389 TaxID=2835862 RepID=UPI001BD1E042|nr:Ig-like domain-containing protein [Flagellimonas sp. 389]MBS9463184.1 Ig-like domain-containing protein [Flagellimonas sp. 389]